MHCRVVLVCLQLAVLMHFTDQVWACNGYKMRILKIENCGGDDQIIKIDSNFTTRINKNCEVESNGCVRSKGFQEAKVKYSIKKNGMNMLSGDSDLCGELEKQNPEATGHLQMIGFPTNCPVEEGERCVKPSDKIDITKHKSYLALARGKEDIEIDVTHDTGKSCFKIQFEVYK